jgi:hypothetical protein
MKSDEQILSELAGAAEGLLYMSESDYPLEPLRLEGSDGPTPELLRGLAGAPADAPVQALSLEQFFRAPISEPDWKGGAEIASARRFQTLVRALRENLAEVRAYKVGSVNMPVYVIGRSPGGSWLGLSTRVVET